MRIHILQHVSFESPGIIDNWIKTKNYPVSYTRFYQGEPLPDISSFDWLIIMGGPMSANDEDKISWLKDEKVFIKKAIDNNKVVIGICLGAQLIANVLGSEIYPNELKEIGWFPIKTTIYATDHDLFSSLPRAIHVFHWHGETFYLPPDALLLAESDACKNQLFVWNERVIGLQFHFEVTQSLLVGMVENGKNELKKAKYVQLSEEILSGKEFIQPCNTMMTNFLEKLEDKFGMPE